MKKVVMFLFVLTFFITSSVGLYASETKEVVSKQDKGVSAEEPVNPLESNGLITPNYNYMPSKDDLYDNGERERVAGSADNQSLYTNKCFTGVTSINYEIKNDLSSDLKIKLRQYTWYGQKLIQTKTIYGDSTTGSSFSDLDSDAYYFIEFVNPCDFSGYLVGNE